MSNEIENRLRELENYLGLGKPEDVWFAITPDSRWKFSFCAPVNEAERQQALMFRIRDEKGRPLLVKCERND